MVSVLIATLFFGNLTQGHNIRLLWIENGRRHSQEMQLQRRTNLGAMVRIAAAAAPASAKYSRTGEDRLRVAELTSLDGAYYSSLGE